MRRIEMDSLPKEAIQLIKEENPLSEDIGIYDQSGDLSAIIITPEAYSYFLRKVEEDEDRQDTESSKDFNSSEELKSAKSINNFLGDEE